MNFLFSAIDIQRKTLAKQEVVEQISFVAEYMSRAIRQAEKDIPPIGSGGCVGLSENYDVDIGGEWLLFLDKDGFCREFSFHSPTNAIQERRSADATAGSFNPPVALTSANIEVSGMTFVILGELQPPFDLLQPRVTFFIDAEDVQLQTTISQRRFDVQE